MRPLLSQTPPAGMTHAADGSWLHTPGRYACAGRDSSSRRWPALRLLHAQALGVQAACCSQEAWLAAPRPSLQACAASIMAVTTAALTCNLCWALTAASLRSGWRGWHQTTKLHLSAAATRLLLCEQHEPGRNIHGCGEENTPGVNHPFCMEHLRQSKSYWLPCQTKLVLWPQWLLLLETCGVHYLLSNCSTHIPQHSLASHTAQTQVAHAAAPTHPALRSPIKKAIRSLPRSHHHP